MSRPNAFPCACTHEAGDSDCAEHPTCNHCGEHLEITRLWAHANVLSGDLATAQRERDEARAFGEDMAALVHMDADRMFKAEAERDEARAKCEGLRADLANTARGIAPFNGTEFALAVREAERETAEAIAAWLESELSDDCAEAIAKVRAGHWRPSPATDKEE